jgi:hypothetical protein
MLDAAEIVLDKHGLEGAMVSRIAAEAGLSPGNVNGLCSSEHNPLYVALQFMWSPEVGPWKNGVVCASETT